MYRFLLAGLVTGSVAWVAQGQASSDTLRYAVQMSGRTTGSLVVWPAGSDERLATFEYNDRGRGPSLRTRLRLDARGIPIELATTGVDYYKAPIEERLVTSGGRVRWTSSVDSGSHPADAGAFYTSMNGVPEEYALLARALLRAPGRTLRILPAGEARIDSVGEMSARVEGRLTRIAHYQISGLDLAPESIWLDARRELVAQGGTWFMVLRSGFEGARDAIIATQDTTRQRRNQRLTTELARRPRGALVLRGAALFDAERGMVLPGRTVVIEGNRITAVGPADSVRVPPGSEVIDAAGKMLLPGLWDMHVHISDDDGLLQLAAGITSVRDLANDTDELLVRKRRFDEGRLIGPRITLAGFMDGPGPFAGPTKVLVATEAEARAAVNRYADLGYVQIKIYSSIDPKLVPAIIDQAHRRGLRVSGHIPAFMTAERAVRLGLDEIQHANFLFLNFFGDSVDTRTPLRFTTVAQRGALLDLGSDSVRAFVSLLKERGVVVDPTLNVFERQFGARRGTIQPGFEAVAERLPAALRRGLLSGGLPVPGDMGERYRASFRAMLAFVKMLHDAGVPLVAGTDAFAGLAYHRELELYTEAGIPPADVLRIATLGAARVAKLDDRLGSVAPGKLADVILVDGDPTRRMSDIRRVVLVVKDGTVYDPAAMYRSVSIRPAVAHAAP